MEIRLDPHSRIEEITHTEFNVQQINSIKNVKGGVYRQNSKTPTFCFDVPRYISHLNG